MDNINLTYNIPKKSNDVPTSIVDIKRVKSIQESLGVKTSDSNEEHEFQFLVSYESKHGSKVSFKRWTNNILDVMDAEKARSMIRKFRTTMNRLYNSDIEMQVFFGIFHLF